jgi:mannosyltransferase OCH1-like enzyme
MQVSQIFLNDDDSLELSPYLQYATNTVKDVFSGADYKLYGRQALRELIKSHYDEEVLWAFDTLRPHAYKADLGRFCILNAIGGWYFDIGVRAANAVEIGQRIKLLAFRDIQKYSLTSFACSIGILYAQPSNHALSIAIRQIVENCKRNYYGITPLCPTGPTLLGQAIARHGSDADYVFGDYLELTQAHDQKNRAFVLPDGTILGWGKPANGGDLTELGATGTNNYNELWFARQVYGEKQ